MPCTYPIVKFEKVRRFISDFSGMQSIERNDRDAPSSAHAVAAAPSGQLPTADAVAETEIPCPVDVDWSLPDGYTVTADAFYRDIGRTGIRLGPHFQMVRMMDSDAKQAVLR